MRQIIATVFFLSIFLFASNSFVSAQVSDSLSKNSEEYFQQISAILLNTPSKANQQKSQELLDRLYARWTIGRFNKAEKDAVRSMIETMRKKKLKTYPYLYEYIYALTYLAESKQLPKSIVGWHMYAEKQLEHRQQKYFLNFVEFTTELLENDRFYYERSVSWYHRQAKFKFVLDTNLLVQYEHLSLVCATKKDSSKIIKTQGTYNYDQKTFTGKEGTVKWSRFGPEIEDSIYVEFQDYKIDVKTSIYVVDSVIFHYDRFFNNPVLGQFTEKIMSSPASKRTSYPRFQAYRNDFALRDVYPGISYYGGFNMQGIKLYGTNGEGDAAYVTLKRKSEIIGKVYSGLFSLAEEKLESEKSEVVFYMENDSIYHPDLHFRYRTKLNRIELYTNEEGVNMIPFFDSYHELDIYAPALFWTVDSSQMQFHKIKGVHSKDMAAFVSSNYFSEKEFYQIQGIDDINPMYTIQRYLKTYDEREIQLNALSSFMKKSPEQVSAMLIGLENQGFLVYNTREQKAIVKDRFFDFLLAKTGRKDYDVIRMQSVTKDEPNAVIDLQSFSLDVNGVPKISLSDSQQVYIYPYDDHIEFRKNRDFTFDGRIQSGLFDYYSRENTFVYDSFMIRLNYIDSLVFRVVSTDSLDQIDTIVKVKNIVSEMNGKLYIDMPFNKSGRQVFKQYPIFISDEASFVYFNSPDIQDSTLSQENFYYRIDPFRFDSLTAFSTQGMSFQGTLTSAGIFPPISEPLVVLPDYSLGFAHKTPAEGYPIYGGKATFTDTIFLDNNGFRGKGSLNYLNSTSSSKEYIFYPDSVVADTAFNFKVLESPDEYGFPYAYGDTVNIWWDIEPNTMHVSKIRDSFDIYQDSKHNGEISLNPDKMGGKGSFFFGMSEIQSNDFDFKFSELTADSANFFLRKDADTMVFQSNGYFAKIDFEQQMGWFNHLYEDTYVGFPYNNFKSNLDEVEWKMNNDVILLKSELGSNYAALDTLNDYDLIDYSLKGPEFISQDESSDSIIRFFAGQAAYNLSNYTIDVDSVKLVKIGDAAIFPNQGYVKILKDGGIQPFQNATIIADTVNKYHRIYDAEVFIVNRHSYYGSGYINYIDRNKTAQPIFLPRFEMSSDGVTQGLGEVQPGELFFLSPEYFFAGEVKLRADNEFYNFIGGYRINEDCIGLEDKWVSFDQFLNPNDIFFDISDSTIDLDQLPARFGLAYSEDKRNYYPLVLQPTEHVNDQIMIDAFGKINYDTTAKAYRVGEDVPFGQTYSSSNSVALNIERCIFEGEGILNLGFEDVNFNTISAGYLRHLIIPDSTYISNALLLNFPFDKEALKMMLDSIRVVDSYKNISGEGLIQMLTEKVLDSEQSNKLAVEVSLYGQMGKIPKELEHTFIFSDIDMKWDSESRSFISRGPIGLGYIAGTAVNKYFDGYVQVEKGRTGGGIHFYLKLNEDKWYFFTYKSGVMQVLSSDDSFNEYLTNLKPSKRIINDGTTDAYYEFVTSTRRKMTDFKREMEAAEKRLR